MSQAQPYALAEAIVGIVVSGVSGLMLMAALLANEPTMAAWSLAMFMGGLMVLVHSEHRRR